MKKIGALFTSKYAIGFGLGLASAIIGYKAYKSKKVRKAIVNLLARIKKTRDDVKFAVASIKEEAEDLCAEATEQKKSAEGGK